MGPNSRRLLNQSTHSRQVRLQPARDVATILEGEPALRPASHPRGGLQVALRRGRHGPLAELASYFVDCDEGVGALVRVDAHDYGHVCLLRSLLVVERPGGRHAFIEGVPRLLSSHPGRTALPGGWRIRDKPQLGWAAKNEPTHQAPRS